MRDRKRKTDAVKLREWQGRMQTARDAYAKEEARMDRREKLYSGDHEIKRIVEEDHAYVTPHVRNIVAENIEATVSTVIPQPKVTAQKPEDEPKAKLIEDFLRNELDRMPFEVMNDIMERTVPIQGGGYWLVEWNNAARTHTTVGELDVSTLHPKEVIPQDGVYSRVEDMDYIILMVPQTKAYIYDKYGIDVSDESESDYDAKTLDDSASMAEDMVTQFIAYYRNDSGGIGLYSWVNDVQLEDLEDYQARRLRRCTECQTAEPPDDNGDTVSLTQEEIIDTLGGSNALPLSVVETMVINGSGNGTDKKKCPVCGNDRFEYSEEDYETVHTPITRNFGEPIPGDVTVDLGETGEVDILGQPIRDIRTVPTRIPYYKPDIYPVILQKNISVFGKLLGSSDVDLIESQQNTVNRIETKIIDKLLKSGSVVTLPEDTEIDSATDEMRVFRIKSPDRAQMINTITLQGDISQDMAYLQQVYEESRQLLGVTDSFQGRRDPTATSGKAKEFAAMRSAGRLESKRVMKQAAFADLFEAMFKFSLAYMDEPRKVVSRDNTGGIEYKEFNRYDFLEQDDDGKWYWNDRFLFSCDTATPLATNREALWQETLGYYQAGAFGNPQDIETQIMFWQKMEHLHYPDAGTTKAMLEQKRDRMIAAQQAAMAQSQPQISPERDAQIKETAMRDAIAEQRQRTAGNPGVTAASGG